MSAPANAKKIKIVAAGPEQIETAASLFDAYRQFYRRPSDLQGARRFISERLSRKESVLYLALVESNGGWLPAGFVHLYPTFSSLAMKPLWILNDLYVAPEARRHGVAKVLMDRARELAISTGAEGLALETAVGNHPAQRLYEQLGYKRDDEFYRYFLPV